MKHHLTQNEFVSRLTDLNVQICAAMDQGSLQAFVELDSDRQSLIQQHIDCFDMQNDSEFVEFLQKVQDDIEVELLKLQKKARDFVRDTSTRHKTLQNYKMTNL